MGNMGQQLITVGLPALVSVIIGLATVLHKTNQVDKDFRELLKSILIQKSEALNEVFGIWKRNLTQEAGIPKEYIHYWERLSEIRDCEEPIRRYYYLHNMLRGIILVLVLLALISAAITFIPTPKQALLISFAWIATILSVFLYIIMYFLANKLSKYLNLGIFIRG